MSFKVEYAFLFISIMMWIIHFKFSFVCFYFPLWLKVCGCWSQFTYPLTNFMEEFIDVTIFGYYEIDKILVFFLHATMLLDHTCGGVNLNL